jgi:hypothetical protein
VVYRDVATLPYVLESYCTSDSGGTAGYGGGFGEEEVMWHVVVGGGGLAGYFVFFLSFLILIRCWQFQQQLEILE